MTPERAGEPIEETPPPELFWRRRAWWIAAGHASLGIYASTALSFVATVVAARTLQPRGFGALELAVAAVAGLATFLDFSLEETVIHHGSVAVSRGDWRGLRALVRTSLRIDLAIGIALFILISAVASPLAAVVSDSSLPPLLIRLAAIEALVITANGTTGAMLVVSRRPHFRAWAAAFSNLARLSGVVIGAAIEAGPAGMLLGLVIGSAIGSANQALWAWRVAQRNWSSTSGGDERSISTREVVVFGFHSSATTTLIAIRTAITSVLIGRRFGPEAVGLFAVALFPVALSEVASSPLRLMMLSEQAMLSASGRLDVVRRSIRAYTKLSLFVGIPSVVIGWIVLPHLLPALYGVGYEAATGPARVLLIAAFASLLTAWAKGLPAAIGRPAVRTAMSAFELLLVVAALALLLPHGLIGAAVAVSTVAAVVACAWLLTARRMLRDAPSGT